MRGWDERQKTTDGIQIITDLYNNHQKMAYHVVKGVLGQQVSKEGLEDLVQEGFLQMLNRSDRLEGMSSKEAACYMCSTMFHAAISEGRKISGRPQVSFTEILEQEEWSKLPWYGMGLEEQLVDEMERSQMVSLLYVSLDQLAQKEYDLIMGHYFFGIKDAMIGQWLGIREAHVRTYRRRAVKKLSKIYKKVVEQERNKRVQNRTLKDRKNK